MVELEKPIKFNKDFAITAMVEHKAAPMGNDMVIEDQWIEISGYASRMYYADSNGLVIDADQQSVETFGMDLRRLKNGILPILFNHNQDKPVGSVMEATYDKDGLFIKAKIFKYKEDELTNFVYHSVKNGVIKAFSVGMLVKGFDMVEQDGDEFLQLAKSEVIEISLVSVPSNHEALFRIQNMKSIDGIEKTITLLRKEDLKALGDTEVCNGFSCAWNKHKEIESQKGVEVSQEINTPVEDKDFIAGVTPEAMDELVAINETPEEPVPPVQDTEAIEGTTVTSGEVEMDADHTLNDKPGETPQEDLEPSEPESIDDVKVGLDALNALDVSELSNDDLEAVYEVLANLVEKIEARVVQEIVQEYNTISAPVA